MVSPSSKAPPNRRRCTPAPRFPFSNPRRSHPHPVCVGASQDPTKTLNISGCRFLSNYVTAEDEDSWGGGVAALGGEVSINNTVFQNNSGEIGYIHVQRLAR